MCLTSCEVHPHSNKRVSVWLYTVDIHLNCEDITDILISDPWGGDFCRGCQTCVRCASVPSQRYLHLSPPDHSSFVTGEEFDLCPNV